MRDTGRRREGPATGAAIGIGGGTGGAFGTRHDGLHLTCPGATEKSEEAVGAGLRWLRNHQDREGFWDCDGFEKNCKLNLCGGAGDPDGDLVVMSLSLLAYLGAGQSHKSGEHKKVVRDGLKHLKRIQTVEGRFPSEGPTSACGHALATLAMCEAYAFTSSPLFKQSAQGGIDHILAAAFAAHGDAVWQILAVRCAKEAGLSVPDAALARCRAWLDSRTTDTGVFDGAPGAIVRSWAALQVAAAHARTRLGEAPAASASGRSALYLVSSGRVAGLAGGDPIALHFGSLVAHATDGDTWAAFHPELRRALLPAQRPDRDQSGSRDPVGTPARALGRVGTTALMTLCLEIPYRYRWTFDADR